MSCKIKSSCSKNRNGKKTLLIKIRKNKINIWIRNEWKLKDDKYFEKRKHLNEKFYYSKKEKI